MQYGVARLDCGSISEGSTQPSSLATGVYENVAVLAFTKAMWFVMVFGGQMVLSEAST